MSYDVAIVGGGPAGLACAIEAARRGLSTVVVDRQTWPIDKACGEGLMPAGLAALERLGALALLDRRRSAIFERIVWRQENGTQLSAQLAAPGGLGVRRVALSAALAEAARRAGAELRGGTSVRGQVVAGEGVQLELDGSVLEARVLVAADGLNSSLRRALTGPAVAPRPRRYGLRRHFALAPWDRAVEVHFALGVEAYVTPVGLDEVGVAFLWEADLLPAGDGASFEVLLSRFPELARRLAGVESSSEVRGAGPLLQPVARRVSERMVLLGDAAGYVDAITGEGLTLAFEAAATLGELLPGCLAAGASAASLRAYEARIASGYRRYARLAGALVWAARHPRLRRRALDTLALAPGVFGWALRAALPAPRAALLAP